VENRPTTDEASAPPAPDDPLVGRVVGDKWRVVRPIGRGGMGVVYEGVNVAIGKRVALKFIETSYAAEADVVTRFQREAEAASSVESAHIVEVFDTGRTPEGQPYLVMELLRGESLGQRIKRFGRLPVAEAVHVAVQALRGLARAHAAGVIHRDLKPDNVFLVDRDDDPLFVKILDFGISKILPRGGEVSAGTLTHKGTVLGTPFYMSPEQAQAHADLDGRADLFSIGAILHECLTGKPPHHGLTTYEAVIVAICTRDVPDVRDVNPDVPRELAQVVTKALARDRDARYASAVELLGALRAAVPTLVSARDGASSLPTPVVPMRAPVEPTAPPTRTTWSSKNAAPAALSSPPSSRRAPAARLVALGLSAGAIAFVGTLLVMRARAEQPMASPPAPSSPVPEVTLRLVVPHGARVLVDGVARPDGVVRGPALSSHEVRVELEGAPPIDRAVILDGRAELAIDAPAAPTPSAIDARPPVRGAGGAPPATKKSATPPVAAPPPSGGGLKLKVDP
jgi:serine/threonine-protein kinase